MAVSQSDRVKAARLRKRTSLTDAQRTWLAEYERRTAKATIRAAKAKPSSTVYTHATPVVRGPQLAIAGTSNATGGHIHATTPPEGVVDPTANLWSPTVPPASSGAEPPPPGAPPPPTEGAPVVGAAPVVDERAGVQLAALVCGIAFLGVKAGRELLADMEVPDEVRAMLADLDKPENIVKGLDELGAACKRLAVKYQLKSVPATDELVVGVVVAASAAAVWTKTKRKKLKAPTKKPQVTAANDERARTAPSSPSSPRPEPAAAEVPDELAGVWGKP